MESSVLIVDDHPVFRDYLKAVFDDEGGFIVETADSGIEGLDMAFILKPDFVLADISLPDLPGVKLTRKIKAARPFTHVVILGMSAGDVYRTEAFRAGAIGYFLKDSDLDGLIQGIKAIRRGGWFLGG